MPALRLQADQQLDGVAVTQPARRVDRAEQPAGLRRPGPPQVVGHVTQARELHGDLDAHRGVGLDLGQRHGRV